MRARSAGTRARPHRALALATTLAGVIAAGADPSTAPPAISHGTAGSAPTAAAGGAAHALTSAAS